MRHDRAIRRGKRRKRGGRSKPDRRESWIINNWVEAGGAACGHSWTGPMQAKLLEVDWVMP